MPGKVAGAKSSFSILGVPSRDNHLIPCSCLFSVSQHMDGFLQGSRMKGRMLKTYCKLCFGMTNTISHCVRLPGSPKHFQYAPTAHTAILVLRKAKPYCSSSGGCWGTVTWRAGKGRHGSLSSFQGPFHFPTSWQTLPYSSKLRLPSRLKGLLGPLGPLRALAFIMHGCNLILLSSPVLKLWIGLHTQRLSWWAITAP